ncbi:hypothetical protein WUBG_07346 [Wuchereria bancrofti]|uniref:Uncharacterized protein n=1 Tax=Wuchereria bancrofti TaxID=6293 RepID=J9B424_WUCBA|nr:hypothetical protein WUBG_07346 [Wuchereria bancrofti]
MNLSLVGIPSWASYTVFAGITLTLGCILGFFIVCIIDRVFPTGEQLCRPEKKSTKKDQKNKSKKDEGKKKDDEQSQDERNSQEDFILLNIQVALFLEESADESVRNRKGAKNEVKKKK